MAVNSVLVPVKDTPKTAQMIAQKLIPSWSKQTESIVPFVIDDDFKIIAKNLWEYCRKTYNYHEDPTGYEYIRSPKQSFVDKKKGIDCEDYAIIIACVLINTGYSPILRIVDFDGSGWQHIYVICDGIVIDAVNEQFNKEEKFVRKIDFKIEVNHKANGLSGIGLTHDVVKVNDLGFSASDRFVFDLLSKFRSSQKLNRPMINKIANTLGIDNDSEIKELTEYAIVLHCKSITKQQKTRAEIYEEIVEFYKTQPNLSLRTSTSILLQQYSTPSPFGYLMGIYCGIDKQDLWVFEPSAGNGLLTIAAKNTKKVIVNEIDDLRRTNLKKQGFSLVTNIDGSKDFGKHEIYGSFFSSYNFGAVITNPPFGALDKSNRVTIDGYEIKDLDHLMSIRALDKMANNGKAAIIIGGHTTWDDAGRVQSGKNRIFLNYLYNHYNVDDVININGDLFSRQGTSFDIRMILIDGRKAKYEGFSPLKNAHDEKTERTFESLFDRVSESIITTDNTEMKIKLANANFLLVQARHKLSLI